jgi:hypothetical protein
MAHAPAVMTFDLDAGSRKLRTLSERAGRIIVLSNDQRISRVRVGNEASVVALIPLQTGVPSHEPFHRKARDHYRPRRQRRIARLPAAVECELRISRDVDRAAARGRAWPRLSQQQSGICPQCAGAHCRMMRSGEAIRIRPPIPPSSRQRRKRHRPCCVFH